MSAFFRWLACLCLGHVRTDWMRVEWIHESYSWRASEPIYTSNTPEETRFCLRCSHGYQHRVIG